MQPSMLRSLRCLSKSFGLLQTRNNVSASSYCRLLHAAVAANQKPADRGRGGAAVANATELVDPPKILRIHEPDYLDQKGYKIPTYDLVNIRLQGYDFPVLEKMEAFVHRTAERIGLEVEDCWGIPAQKLKITRLKTETTVVESEYQLNIYERNVQVADVPTTVLPILINIVQAALPVGVTMIVKEHEEEDEAIRFIPDLELKELKEQLLTDGTALKKKKITRIKISSKFRKTATSPKMEI